MKIITGKCVFVFGPSVEEADTSGEEDSEALGDFGYYSSRIAKYVRSKGLKFEDLTAHTIHVRYNGDKVFTVNRDSVEFGTIITDGFKKPILFKYVVTDDELNEKIREYFQIK